MSGDGDSGSEPRVVSFRRRGAPHVPAPADPVEDLSKFQQPEETAEDYKHRMIVNVVAFVFVVALVGAGIWLADTMAAMKKNQDCVLSGRRGCTPVDVNVR